MFFFNLFSTKKPVFVQALNTEKTDLLDLTGRGKNHTRTFDFLGFTHYMGRLDGIASIKKATKPSLLIAQYLHSIQP